MPFMRLTLWGAFASLQSESPRLRRLKTGAESDLPGRRWIACLTLGVVTALAGCASVGPSSSTEQKQKVVAERAQERWQFLMKGDLAGAYQFLSAGSRATTPLDLYKAKFKPAILWREAKVGKVDCEAEICKVMMLITYDVKKMKGIETPIDETWIIENGSAWYVYR